MGEFYNAMIANIRRMYEEKFGGPYLGTDEEIVHIIEDVGALPTGEETDEAILDEMRRDDRSI